MRAMANTEHANENIQSTEIRLDSGTVICEVTDDSCDIAIRFRHPNGTETRIAGISRMDPKSWGPATFRVYISDGDDCYTASRIVTIVPAHKSE